jgi:putative dimethyl sulfoxide reductase chaperone
LTTTFSRFLCLDPVCLATRIHATVILRYRKWIYKGSIVQLKDLSRPDLAIVCKLFGTLFYYQPKDFEYLPISTYFENEDVETPIEEVSNALNAFKYCDRDQLQTEHERLFTMQEHMMAPPWSSMYLDKESILFGPSTKTYCEFVEHCGLGLREDATDPEDHIGLMLIVLGMLMTDEQDQHVKELLGEYLVTWSDFYFQRLKAEVKLPAYEQLAIYTESLFNVLSKQYAPQVLIKNNYFQA